MRDPITKEQRELSQEWAADMAFAVSRDWLRGYEALVLDLEAVLDKTRMWAIVCQNCEKYEKEKCIELERRLKIAEDSLSQTGAMAMAKVNK